MKNRVGVDIGGTNIKIALITNEGKILYSKTFPTEAEKGYEYTVANIKEEIKVLMTETESTSKTIETIGFGFPGQIDYKSGTVKVSTNIPGWNGVELAKIIKGEFNIPAFVDNDVRCATLGEMKYGAGKGAQNLVCVTVGTGIGSGLVLNGKLYRGASNAAGEIGHIKLSDSNSAPLCGCGDFGCFEAYASGPSIVAMAEDYIRGGKATMYREMAKGEAITPYIVFKAAEQGDAVAIQIFKKIGEYLGLGLTNVINILNPDKIIIGGGIAAAGDLLFNPIRETVNKRAMKIAREAVQIVPAELGNTAGVMGAALLMDN